MDEIIRRVYKGDPNKTYECPLCGQQKHELMTVDVFINQLYKECRNELVCEECFSRIKKVTDNEIDKIKNERTKR